MEGINVVTKVDVRLPLPEQISQSLPLPEQISQLTFNIT